jgi:DNA-binding response OmpR family regulator
MTIWKREAPKVLVVDDEVRIQSVLSESLQPTYTTTTAGSGEEAMALVSESRFDVILLDIHMPGMDGLEVLEVVKRQHPETVVIILTGYASVDNAVHALRHGAFNYLQKPISHEEILESIAEGLVYAQDERQRREVLLKTRQLFTQGLKQLDEVASDQVDLMGETEYAETEDNSRRFLERGPLVIDVYRRRATLHGELLDLTAGEYDLLLCLAQEAPRVLGPKELVERTRGYKCGLEEAREIIRWQVYLLRQKVEADSSSPKYVLNVRGRGYMWAGA